MSARVWIGVMATVLLAACGSSPKPNMYTLLDGVVPSAGKSAGLSVAVMPASVPDLIDRPQMVVRQAGNRVQILEQQRWAEPLRAEIPRLVAADLGRLLESPSVIALPDDVLTLNPDIRLTLDVQRVDASLADGVGVDVVWRLQGRDGKVRQGRSAIVEPLAASGEASYAALVEACRRAFGKVAADVAAAIREMRPAR